MRGGIEGLATPHPLADALPAMLADDEFAVRLSDGLDEALAPVFVTLDCLDSYLDPSITPEDFLSWLAVWVGATTGEDIPIERRRRLVAEAAGLARRRGTAAGLRDQIALLTGVAPEVIDGGGVRASDTPGGDLPGTPPEVVRIRLRGPLEPADRARVEALIAASMPVHLTWELEVVAP